MVQWNFNNKHVKKLGLIHSISDVWIYCHLNASQMVVQMMHQRTFLMKEEGKQKLINYQFCPHGTNMKLFHERVMFSLIFF